MASFSLFFRISVYRAPFNNSEESLRRVRALTGCAPERLVFHKIDLCDAAALSKMLETCPDFHSCIHFAGLKVPPPPLPPTLPPSAFCV